MNNNKLLFNKMNNNINSTKVSNVFNNTSFPNTKLDETFLSKLYDFKNKLIDTNPKTNIYISFGNITVQIYYKLNNKKTVICYVNKFNGDITKKNDDNLTGKNILDNLNDQTKFNYKLNLA